jgi:hypothetical protein
VNLELRHITVERDRHVAIFLFCHLMLSFGINRRGS